MAKSNTFHDAWKLLVKYSCSNNYDEQGSSFHVMYLCIKDGKQWLIFGCFVLVLLVFLDGNHGDVNIWFITVMPLNLTILFACRIHCG